LVDAVLDLEHPFLQFLVRRVDLVHDHEVGVEQRLGRPADLLAALDGELDDVGAHVLQLFVERPSALDHAGLRCWSPDHRESAPPAPSVSTTTERSFPVHPWFTVRPSVPYGAVSRRPYHCHVAGVWRLPGSGPDAGSQPSLAEGLNRVLSGS